MNLAGAVSRETVGFNPFCALHPPSSTSRTPSRAFGSAVVYVLGDQPMYGCLDCTTLVQRRSFFEGSNLLRDSPI